MIPQVNLTVTVPETTEGGGAEGELTVALSVVPRDKVVVHYQTEGNAKNGADYDKLSGTVTFKPGVLKQHIYIIPSGNLGGMAEKTVKIKLETNPAYSVETKMAQKVEIFAGG